MNKDRKINVGVIGVGKMGGYHVGVYSEIPAVNLVGVFDSNLSTAKEISEKMGTASYESLDDLLDNVDAVSIATPTFSHYTIAKKALERGVHVLVEKPITNNLSKAEDLFNIATAKNLVLHVGHVERFNGAVHGLKNIISNPYCIDMRRVGPFDKRGKYDGVVLDLMIHDIDILLNLVNSEIVSLNAVGARIFTDMEDIASVQIFFKNGCIANILASRVTQEKIRVMSITQEREYVVLNFMHQEIMIYRDGQTLHGRGDKELNYRQESMVERLFVHKGNALKHELQYFIDCVSGNAVRRISVDNELQSLKVALRVLDEIKLSDSNVVKV